MPRDPILSAFDALSRRQPGRALVMSAASVATAADVDGLARRLGPLLEAGSPAPDGLVGLAAPNGPAFLAGFLALRRAGLGIALLDGWAPEADLRRTAAALRVTAVLRCRSGWPRGLASWTLEPLDAPAGAARVHGAPIVKVTSGSTGSPRGVRASAENVCADEGALCASMGLRDDERILAAIPMAHSYGFSSVALPVLLRGSLAIVPADGGPLAPLALAHAAGATFFPTVPAYLQGLVSLRRPQAWPRCVRLVVSAGALLPPATAGDFRDIYRLPVHAFYGASECGGICYDREGGAAERGTVGTPVDGVRVGLDPLPGIDGEGAVTVASAAVAAGYLPVDERLGDGLFRTSDRGCWAGGELRLRGRIDALINVKGRKVDPAEVEGVLASLPGVLDVVVVGAPSQLDGNHVVRAFVACRRESLRAEDVLAFCRAQLAEHKVPRSVRLVEAIPRTRGGKIDRPRLLALDGDTAAS
jgi:long-chain acyl-CoA synthetase